MPAMKEKLMTVKEVAAALGVTPAAVYLWISQRKIKARSFGTNTPEDGKRPKLTRRIDAREFARIRSRISSGLPLLATR